MVSARFRVVSVSLGSLGSLGSLVSIGSLGTSLALGALLGCSRESTSRTSAPASSAPPAVSVHPVPPAASTTLTSATTAPPTRPFNVILLTVDSLRADMPWAGYPRAIAPRLRGLYGESIAYTRAYSTSSFTSKSVPGILSGRYPSSLERTASFFSKYSPKNEFMCERMAAAQIPCVTGQAHGYLDKGLSGLDQGFSEWRLVPGITFDYQTDPYVTSQKLTPLAIEMLGQVAARHEPFFAWFHYMDPHDQYQSHPESPHFGQRRRDLYDEEVFYTDLWLGKLLDWIQTQPFADHTVLAVTADHGEAFGEHGVTRHAHEVWEELVHVPLFFRVPGAQPRVIDEPRAQIDLVPTFLELTGAPADPSLPGASLVKEFRGAEAEARDVIVDLPEDNLNERRRALIHGPYKLIAFGKDNLFQLFDLTKDPKEAHDLVKSEPAIFRDMKERYRAASQRIPEVEPHGGVKKQ